MLQGWIGMRVLRWLKSRGGGGLKGVGVKWGGGGLKGVGVKWGGGLLEILGR